MQNVQCDVAAPIFHFAFDIFHFALHFPAKAARPNPTTARPSFDDVGSGQCREKRERFPQRIGRPVAVAAEFDVHAPLVADLLQRSEHRREVDRPLAERQVLVKMTLTSPACPSAQQIPSEVRYKVKAIPEVTEAWVEIVWEPPWDKERMSEAAKLALGFF